MHKVSISAETYDLEWPLSEIQLFCGRPRWNSFSYVMYSITVGQSIATNERNNALHTASIKIYSVIARFPCYSMAFLFLFGFVRQIKLATRQCLSVGYMIVRPIVLNRSVPAAGWAGTEACISDMICAKSRSREFAQKVCSKSRSPIVLQAMDGLDPDP